MAFTAVAAFQLAWGVLALVRGNRLVAVLGLLIGTGALAGWALAKVSGIPFVAGLDQAEPIQTADGLAAGLALTSVLALGSALWPEHDARLRLKAPLPLMAVGVSVLTVFGMVTAGSHAHAAGDGHGSHGTVAADHHGDETGAGDHVEDASAATVPYDPTKPIDLSGVEGVTPEQQAAAENIIAVTLHGLPQWADPAHAEANGFHSIGDGFTGTEHFVNEAHMDDDVILDPDVPESLVYDTSGGGRRLVAAMYMLKRGTPLEQAPDLGGNLMQWHTHDNLCYNADGKVRGITDASGACPAGLVKPVETPMIHVWLEPHPCGPFAALEGIAGGRIPDGEEVLCDHAHGD
ncbi:MFS transporter [Blastococcus aurantiacus]|uniref:MFS transporter n=1 Tax=Blastococcus aurantiacus TaxID=1550231 RepID=UPI001160001A|nr:MFS transporter [Blastococcus aurantiacus]